MFSKGVHMEKIGFIGYGAMGSMIIRRILYSGILDESNIVITTRTLSKLNQLQESHPLVEIAPDNATVARKSQKIFIFVNTGEVKGLIEEIKDYLTDKTHIIYISAGLTIENLEKVFPGKISKVIPTLTSEVKEGISLVAHNFRADEEDARFVEEIFKAMGEVKMVEKNQFNVGTNLTSSGPAFLSAILLKFTESALKEGYFTREEVEEMVTQTMYGTLKLLQEENMSLEEVMDLVATPGGITEEGLKVLDQGLPRVFQDLFRVTLDKYEKTETKLNREFIKY
jgi:pyrroline-5-carboxylate reductase